MSVAQANEYARLRSQLSGKAAAAFEQAALAIEWENPEALQQLHALAATLMDTYGAASAELGARWLQACAADAGALLATAAIATGQTRRSLHDGLGWCWARYKDGELGKAQAAKEMGSKAAAATLSAADETTMRNTPRGTIYTRVAQPDSCAFCRVVAAEPRVWTSGEGASFKCHDGCNCVPVPYNKPSDIDGYKRLYERNMSEYRTALEALKDPEPELARRLATAKQEHAARTDEDWNTTNEVLVAMRHLYGIEH